MVPLPDCEELREQWLRLEAAADGSFFTSWSWIGCLVRGLGEAERPQLVRARDGDRIVGLGLLGGHINRRHRMLTSRVRSLNATGNPLTDEISIEHNGFLVDREEASATARGMCRHLAECLVDWEELRLDGVAGDWSSLAQDHPELEIVQRTYPCYCVDLNAIRTSGSTYLEWLSPNARAQIRRSLREYSKFGAVLARSASTRDEAIAFLRELRELHQRYWTARGEAGSFSNAFFDRFHGRLVAENFDQGSIQLVKITAGEFVLGYLYNFVYQGWIGNYQSGFDYGLCDRHCRPGLVAHALAVDLNLALGHRAYDFLAGDYQYKRTLGAPCGSMHWIVLRRNLLKFRVENRLRGLKHLVRQMIR